MKTRLLFIGRWKVEFRFAGEEYDVDEILERLYRLGAGSRALRQALDLMESEAPNTGFTFANPYEHEALVVIGPTSSGAEFIDTLVHEVHHLAVAVADDLGVDLEAETPAYIAGDSARELAAVVCELGCSHCRRMGD